jgi:hypothetical protein
MMRSRVELGLMLLGLVLVLLVFVSCQPTEQTQVTELRNFPLENMDGVLTKSNVELDKQASGGGKGSLKMSASEPTSVKLFEVTDLDVENARLIYQARLRCENLKGKAFLEMWCRFPGKGEFFSRGLQSTVSGTTDWVSCETPFFLKKGEKPDLVRLNVSIDGTGTVWVDNMKLLKGPLK